MISVQEIVKPIYGLPCWHVRQGYGSFLTLQFGQPHQTIYPVIYPKKTSINRRHPSRCVVINSEWHLWIYCCGWRIFQAGEELAHNESSREIIERACAILDGQVLTQVELSPHNGGSRFIFDLEGVLETGPYEEELSEQWFLYCLDGLVLTYRSDGMVTYSASDTKSEEMLWEQIETMDDRDIDS